MSNFATQANRALKLDDLPGAIDDALQSRDVARVIELFETYGEAAIGAGRVDYIRHHLGTLAYSNVAKSPELVLLDAWCSYLSGDLERTRHALDLLSAAATPDKVGAESARYRALATAISAFLATSEGDPLLAAKRAREALHDLPLSVHWVRAALRLATAHGDVSAGLLNRALQSLREAERDGLAGENLYVTVVSLCLRARVYRHRGEYRHAERCVNSARRLCLRDGATNAPVHGYVAVAQARIDFQRLALAAAETNTEKALAMFQRIDEVASRVDTLLFQARILRARNNPSAAAASTARAIAVAREGNYVDHWNELRGALARDALAKGELAMCRHHLADAIPEPGAISATGFIPAVIHCVAMLREKRFGEAIDYTRPWREYTEKEALWGIYLEFALVEIIALTAVGEIESAAGKLEARIAMASHERLLQPFAFTRSVVPQLRPLLSEGAMSFLTVAGAVAPEQAANRCRLTRREREILKRVSDGCSNQVIADELFISLSTVKTHIHNVLEKLRVGNRTAAVKAARERGMLPES